jgi:hypothetical protein
VDTIEAIDRIAPLAGFAFIAARSVVIVEVGAACSLQQVAPDRRHVANLRRCAGHNGTDKNGVTRLYGPMLRDRRIPRCRANQQAAIFPLVDCGGEARNIDQRVRPLNCLAHQIDQVGATSQVPGPVRAAQADSIGNIVGASICKEVHSAASAWNVVIASTIPL